MAASSRSGAVLRGKCPRCRQGDIFTYPISRLSKFNVMNERCPHCDVMLQPEPGFYQGAMYVSYAFAVALIVTIGILLYLLGDPPEWVYISAIVALTILLAPLNYRASRILYLHLFGGIKFDASK
nr:MAG: DUF983 domain-containing protein [Bacteroidota bacterium]